MLAWHVVCRVELLTMADAPASQSFYSIQRPSLLLVDDEPAVLRGLLRVLKANYPALEICCASDGLQAMALMAERHFDVVLTDVNMPRMGGLALLLQVAQHHPETVRIVHSSHSETASDSLIRLAQHVLPKPAMAIQILQAVNWGLKQAAAQKPLSNTRCA
jgi:DNA-binding NtrC family response regulator